MVQVQLAHAIQRSARRYVDEKDAIQPGEKVWLFTSKPSADRKLAIPYAGKIPMWFYRRWRRFKQHFSRPEAYEATQVPRAPVPHEYLALNEIEGPPLPRCNRAVSNVYPALPAKSSSAYSNDPRVAAYTVHGHRVTAKGPSGDTQYAAWKQQATPKQTSLHLAPPKPEATPPAADARPTLAVSTMEPPVTATSLGLPPHHSTGLQQPDDIFPKGPIGDVMKHHR